MCLGIPGRVERVNREQPDFPMAMVNFSGVTKEVCLACTPEAEVGDYVLVHVGFAISRLDAAEANQIFQYLAEIERLSTRTPPPSERGDDGPLP